MPNIKSIEEMITCPISGDIMKEPVMAADGHTYDRECLLKWLARNPISPITREPLNAAGLYKNISVKFMCDQYNAGAFDDLKKVRESLDDGQKEPMTLQGQQFDVGAKVVYYNNDVNKMITTFGCSNLKFEDIMNGPGVDLVLIIDLSGSTSGPITAQDEKGKNMETGFSINDILRHTGKTVIAALRPQDRVSFIVFDEEAHIIFDFMSMSEMNKVSAKEKIHGQKPDGGLTNIWGGCDFALKLLDKREDKSRNSAAILLTDGQPTKSPARGEKDKMMSHKKTMPFPTPFYGFGFGYVLKPFLLNGLCTEATNGAVSHISDGSMVATVFNNTVGLIVNTACMNVTMTIRILKDAIFNEEKPIDGDLNYTLTRRMGKNVLVVNLGAVQFEQSRETVINITPQSNEAEIGISYTYAIGGQEFTLPEEIVRNFDKTKEMNEMDAKYNYFRTFVVDKLKAMIMTGKKSFGSEKQERKQLYDEVIEYYLDNNLEIDKKSVALMDTWKDQVYIAVASKNSKYNGCFEKWGMYYFEQLICALSKQYTPNFKDEACKIFGGDMFKAMVEVASEAFDNEPAPERTCSAIYSGGGQFRSRGGNTNIYRGLSNINDDNDIDMSRFNNQGGGCFTGNSMVLVDGGELSSKHYRRVDQIKPGDSIITICDINKSGMDQENRQRTKVLKVIETKYDSLTIIKFFGNTPSGNALTEEVGITSWHPIKFEDTDGKNDDSNWEFPKEILYLWKNDINMKNISVYTFILETGHVVFLGKQGMMAITLAHNYKNGILDHAYFGTDAIKKDLEKIPGWEEGHVVLKPEWFKKTGPISDKYNKAVVGKICMDEIREMPAMI